MQTKLLEIENANYLSNYKIEISFSDGKAKTIDFEGFLRQIFTDTIRVDLCCIRVIRG